jgi:hypothetical protein
MMANDTFLTMAIKEFIMMNRFKKIKYMIKNFVYGMTVAEMVWEAKKEKFKRNAAMMVVAIGDLIGLPTFSTLYKLNLLKYWLPEVETWKRHLLREKDFLE